MKKSLTIDRSVVIIALSLAISAVLIFMLIMTVSTSIKNRTIEVQKAQESMIEKTHSECVLAVNNKYVDSLKRVGTPMTINDKKVTGNTVEDWKAIDEQRKIDTAKCDER